jgi:hypothetical protein
MSSCTKYARAAIGMSGNRKSEAGDQSKGFPDQSPA